MGGIDVNKIEDDIVEEYIAPGNEDAIIMLERLSQEIFWQSPQEIYLRGILNEIKAIVDKIDGVKSTNVGVYGADHKDLSLGSSPITPITPGASDVRNVW